MSNGIRQGSLISPLLFSVYLDELSGDLSTARIGYHIGGCTMNHLAYAHDLVLMAPSAAGLNELFSLCKIYADENYAKFSASKKVFVSWCFQINLELTTILMFTLVPR